jgi:hypothetical protein
VRLITLRSAILARLEIISSCTPAAKNAFCFSSLRLSNGKTAMLFSAIVVDAGETKLAGADELGARTLGGELRWRTRKNTARLTIATPTKATAHNQPPLAGSPETLRGSLIRPSTASGFCGDPAKPDVGCEFALSFFTASAVRSLTSATKR